MKRLKLSGWGHFFLSGLPLCCLLLLTPVTAEAEPADVTFDRSAEAVDVFDCVDLTGWINCRSARTGSGGNRIITAIDHGGDGFDLVMTGDGRLQLGVNQWPDGSPAKSSPGRIPADASAPAANWRFFAVTYDATRTPAEVKFYFGGPDQPARLDATAAYDGGPVGEDLGPLAVGHFNILTRPSHTDRMFRGLIDQICVYGSPTDASGALDLHQIRTLQRIGE
jgi:hypothetical protein